MICAVGALLSLASDDTRRTAQSLDQRSDADVIMVCDVLDSHVNGGPSQHGDIGRPDGNIDETSGGNRTADGLSSGDRVEFRTGQHLRYLTHTVSHSVTHTFLLTCLLAAFCHERLSGSYRRPCNASQPPFVRVKF